MFELRIICDPGDRDGIGKTLAAAFTTGQVREHPTRDGQRMRLYITADHRPDDVEWPTPEKAYALAPSIISEIGWTARAAAETSFGTELGREFWLRKAALLDRIALSDESAGYTLDPTALATEAARRLLAYDRDGNGCYGGAPYRPEHPQSEANPRAYVRQEYAHWAKHQ
ncbi:hypothetical protein [Streptomyces sp. NPDC096193]|uniref:hypothetical protein n=1 Tax=Streptomyces sp. NPDC096193 TaxID=3155821 RepID=UPI003332A6A1